MPCFNVGGAFYDGVVERTSDCLIMTRRLPPFDKHADTYQIWAKWRDWWGDEFDWTLISFAPTKDVADKRFDTIQQNLNRGRSIYEPFIDVYILKGR